MEKNPLVIVNVLPEIMKLNALLKNIMRQTGAEDPNEAIRLVNSSEWRITKPEVRWRRNGNVVYTTLTSTGMTKNDWERHLGMELRNGMRSQWSESVRSSKFEVTSGVEYTVAIIDGRGLASSRQLLTTDMVVADASRRCLRPLPLEACFLLREAFTDNQVREMGLWNLTMMHEVEDQNQIRLGIRQADHSPTVSERRFIDSAKTLDVVWPEDNWNRAGHGLYSFAFLLSRVDPD